MKSSNWEEGVLELGFLKFQQKNTLRWDLSNHVEITHCLSNIYLIIVFLNFLNSSNENPFSTVEGGNSNPLLKAFPMHTT